MPGWLEAAAKAGFRVVFPSTGVKLSGVFVTACGRADSRLRCGFGDTLSSMRGGDYAELDRWTSALVVAALAGRAGQFARACVEADREFLIRRRSGSTLSCSSR